MQLRSQVHNSGDDSQEPEEGMTHYHRTTATLNLAREMAKKVMKLKRKLEEKVTDTECQHEIDILAQDAQYILMEVEHREDEK